jgi:N-acyl-D-amino-acid deacylase
MVKTTWVILIVIALGLAACAPDAPEPSGVVIVNARVIDGSGGPSRDVNVRIVGDRIATIGNFEPSAEDVLVDADGLVLAPGFIDVHSHHDAGLFETPGAQAAVSQGITTIVVGQDGDQQYPLAGFFAGLETSPAAINVASFAGHGTLRSRAMGEDYQRHATPEELAEMVDLLRTEMEAGALGFTTGLEYDPGSFSSTEELVELARAAASHGGRYVSHIRSEDQYFWEAIDEIISIGREARIPVHVSHIKLAMSRWWGQADRLTTKLDDVRASGVDITADIYPYRAWNSGFSWLTTLRHLPPGARLRRHDHRRDCRTPSIRPGDHADGVVEGGQGHGWRELRIPDAGLCHGRTRYRVHHGLAAYRNRQ